jgi:hypothetical protein
LGTRHKERTEGNDKHGKNGIRTRRIGERQAERSRRKKDERIKYKKK